MNERKGSPKMNNTPWPDERVKELKRLHSEGYTYSAIARRLGGGVTVGCVAGKAMRLGLKKRDPRGPSGQRPGNTPRSVKRRAPVPEKPVKAPPPLKLEGEPVTLTDLAPGMCKWPIGDPKDPGFHFCALPQHWHSPYCTAHHDAAFNGRPKENQSD